MSALTAISSIFSAMGSIMSRSIDDTLESAICCFRISMFSLLIPQLDETFQCVLIVNTAVGRDFRRQCKIGRQWQDPGKAR